MRTVSLISLLLGLLQAAVLGAAETEVHRWVDAEGVTHFSDSPPEQPLPFETTTVVTEEGRYVAPRAAPYPTPPPDRAPRRESHDDGAAEARCAAWLDELHAIAERRRRGYTAAESNRLRERSSELNRLRQRQC
jgi:uncharacterized protein DUF4124